MHRSFLMPMALALSFMLSGCALFQTRPPPTRRDVQREMREQNERPRTLDYPGDSSSQSGDDDEHDDDRDDDHDD